MRLSGSAVELTKDERRVLAGLVAGAQYRARHAWPAQRSRLQDLGLTDENDQPTPFGLEVWEAGT